MWNFVLFQSQHKYLWLPTIEPTWKPPKKIRCKQTLVLLVSHFSVVSDLFKYFTITYIDQSEANEKYLKSILLDI